MNVYKFLSLCLGEHKLLAQIYLVKTARRQKIAKNSFIAATNHLKNAIV